MGKRLPAPLCEELCLTIPECVGITVTSAQQFQSVGLTYRERECAIHTEGGKNPDYGGNWDEARLDDIHSGAGMPSISSEDADSKCFMRRPGAISAARSKSRPAEPQPPHWNGENLAKKKRPPEPATRPEEEQVNNGGGFWPQKASEKEKQEKEKGKEAGTAKAKGKGMETNTETKKE